MSDNLSRMPRRWWVFKIRTEALFIDMFLFSSRLFFFLSSSMKTKVSTYRILKPANDLKRLEILMRHDYYYS